MESPPSDFLWGHPQTPPLHPRSLSRSLLPLLLLRNPLSLGLFLGLGLRFSPGFLSRTLSMMGFHCLLQSEEGPLLLLVPPLHLLPLLFKSLGVVL